MHALTSRSYACRVEAACNSRLARCVPNSVSTTTSSPPSASAGARGGASRTEVTEAERLAEEHAAQSLWEEERRLLTLRVAELERLLEEESGRCRGKVGEKFVKREV